MVSRKQAQKLLDMLQQVECCLLFIHGLYNNPDETKMDQIRMQLDIDACNRNDCLNAMRLCIYLKDEEQYSLLQEKLNDLHSIDIITKI